MTPQETGGIDRHGRRWRPPPIEYRRLTEASFTAPRGAPVKVIGADPEQVAARARQLRQHLWQTAVETLPPPPAAADDGITTTPTRTDRTPPPWRAPTPNEAADLQAERQPNK